MAGFDKITKLVKAGALLIIQMIIPIYAKVSQNKGQIQVSIKRKE
ncbi:hypothetical protein SPBRAN_2034 [uncultured Candidatus Thioglobus sp.]|nr:hypothetical protein SPBRAN_2034 [uncultured Candidatus Thioglobus sp.]